MIKSLSEEDVHKGIKYNVWSSTQNGNQILDNTYKSCEKGNVYLFFTCYKSDRFLGLAKMKKGVDYTKIFPLWTRDYKWVGIFELEWIFIKDIPFREFRNITISTNDGNNKPCFYLKDAQEIPYNQAFKMFEIYLNYSNNNTILEHFEYYDLRQENYERVQTYKQLGI